MKRLIKILGCILLVLSLNAAAKTTPDEILNAVDQMTPEQVQILSDKLQARYWEPIPQGFFRRMAIMGSLSSASLDDVDLSTANLSNGNLSLDSVSGGEAEIQWWIFNRNCHLGFKFASWESSDSTLTSSGYSSASLANGAIGLVGTYQFIRGNTWQVWTEFGVGAATFAMETIDTPAGQATTIHEYDGHYAIVDIELGVSLRLNPVISLFGAGGYTFADTATLEEGDVESSTELDASGALARMGLSFNF